MGMLDALLAGAGYYNQIQNLGDMQDTVKSTIGDLTTTLPQYSQFRPYTVTTGLANLQADPTGGYSMNLSPEQQALQNQMFLGARGMYSQAMGDTAGREQDIYNRIRAMQTPMEQEQRLATENRMAAQGRLGLSSNQYGGSTPELVAQERAINEAKNAAALSAMQQAQAQQLQQANIGQQMLQAGYVPTTTALGMLTPALQGSQIATQAGGTTADILGQLGLGGLTAQANLEKIRSELMGQGLGMLSGSLAGTPLSTGVDSLLGSLGSKALSALTGLFSGGAAVDAMGNTAGTNVLNYLNTNPYTTGSTGTGYNVGGSAGANALNTYTAGGGANYLGVTPFDTGLGTTAGGVNLSGAVGAGSIVPQYEIPTIG